MSDYLGRLVDRAMGLDRPIRPLVRPRFAPGPALTGQADGAGLERFDEVDPFAPGGLDAGQPAPPRTRPTPPSDTARGRAARPAEPTRPAPDDPGPLGLDRDRPAAVPSDDAAASQRPTEPARPAASARVGPAERAAAPPIASGRPDPASGLADGGRGRLDPASLDRADPDGWPGQPVDRASVEREVAVPIGERPGRRAGEAGRVHEAAARDDVSAPGARPESTGPRSIEPAADRRAGRSDADRPRPERAGEDDEALAWPEPAGARRAGPEGPARVSAAGRRPDWPDAASERPGAAPERRSAGDASERWSADDQAVDRPEPVAPAAAAPPARPAAAPPTPGARRTGVDPLGDDPLAERALARGPSAWTPVRADGRARPASLAAGPTVRVTIGRVEVRAVAPTPPPAAPAAAEPRLSLSDFLQARREGRA